MSKPSPCRFARHALAAALAAGGAALAAAETPLPANTDQPQSGSQELRRNASTAKLVFDRAELETLDANSVAELLKKLPGTGMFADPDSRRGKGKGPDRNLPRILVDGQPMPGGERSPAAALRLPVDLIERVEILRNSSAEFPAAGPGGVINLVLRDVPPKATRNLRLGAGSSAGDGMLRAEGQYGERLGSFGYLLAGAVNSQPLAGRRHTEIQRYTGGSRSEWSFEQAEDSGRANNVSLSPRFNWDLGEGRQFSLIPFVNHSLDERQSRIARSAYADPAAGTGIAASGRDLEEDETRRSSGRLAAELKGGRAASGEWSARLMLQGEMERLTRNVQKYDAAGSLASNTGEITERREGEGALILRGKRLLGESHVLSGGAEWRRKSSEDRQEKRSNDTDALAMVDDRRQVLWAQDEWQLAEQHLLTPGLRWQHQQSRVTDGQGVSMGQGYTAFDPSLHYLWQPGPAWNVRGSLALNGKPPSTRDLSPVVRTASGSNTSANPDQGGNPRLEAERSLSLEIGAEHFLPGRQGTLGLSLFRRQIENQVQRLVQFESGRWVERPYNVGDALLQGGLFDFKVRADALKLPALTLRGNVAYTHTRLVDPVPGLGAGEGPRKSANLGFDYDLGSPRLTLGGNLSYTSALDRESSATVRQVQGQRRQLDFYALYKLGRQLSLRFSAQNVTRAGKGNELQELDAAGNVVRQESDRENGVPTFLIALEGKW